MIEYCIFACTRRFVDDLTIIYHNVHHTIRGMSKHSNNYHVIFAREKNKSELNAFDVGMHT